MLTSPVNWPGRWTATSVSVAPEVRTISSRPAVTTKNGTGCAPASTSTSPPRTGRTDPCAAIRAICAGVSIGNVWLGGEVEQDGRFEFGHGLVTSPAAQARLVAQSKASGLPAHHEIEGAWDTTIVVCACPHVLEPAASLG